MIENVMAHLVRHHFTNFRQGALIEKIVVKSNPRRSSQSRHVGADPFRLSRLIHHKNLLNRDFIGACQRQNWIANLRVGERGVLIKKRFDENRSRDVEKRSKDNSEDGPPDPPGALGYSKD